MICTFTSHAVSQEAMQRENWPSQPPSKSLAANKSLELKSIFNFFDFLVYEDRVNDLCPKNDFRAALNENRQQIYRKWSVDDFSMKQKSTDVKLVLKDGELFVDPYILTTNSTVFEKMFQKVDDNEKGTKIVTLQRKSVQEIVMLLTFLTKFTEINGKS